MSKRKRTKKQPARPAPPPSKKAPQNLSLVNKIKQNWPVWVISVLMACSLVGRFAASSGRQVARTAANQPAETNMTAEEDFRGDLVVQGEEDSTATVPYSLRLPASWHDKIETSLEENVVSFIYDLDATTRVPLFTLTAYTDPAWKKLQAASDQVPGEKLSAEDGIVVVDEIVLDQAGVDQQPELESVKARLPQILESFTTKTATQ